MKPCKWLGRIVSERSAMDPIETGITPKLKPLAGVRAVVFDVYGTLVISGSGDVGSADTVDRGIHIDAALQEVGLREKVDPVPTMEMLHDEIRRSNDQRRSDDCPAPEVDIVDIWYRLLRRCGVANQSLDAKLPVRLAVAYEARANPTWPMPGAGDVLHRLAAAKIPLGIVSNAQVFTPPLVCDLLGDTVGPDGASLEGASLEGAATLAAGGFDLDLCVFSNRFRQSKPGPRLFDVLCRGLQRRGIRPDQAVYVGNDMLNDVWAASQAGLKTAWFVGDQRSCRPRNDDPRCQSLAPELIIENLMQLLDCLEIK